MGASSNFVFSVSFVLKSPTLNLVFTMPPAAISFSINAVLQIAILTVILLYLNSIFRGTRSAQILFAITFTLSLLYFLAWGLNFDVLLFLLGKLLTIISFALVVVFQPEIRRAFRTLGNRRFSLYGDEAKKSVIDIICSAVETMAGDKTGAIIASERGTHLREWTTDATPVGAPLSKALLLSIFYPGAPLHDGGVVIKDETIVAARCVFPLSETETGRGMRHRAAVGLSERSDAVVIVVSEEQGSVSIACDGRLFQNLSHENLVKILNKLVSKESAAALVARAATTGEQHD